MNMVCSQNGALREALKTTSSTLKKPSPNKRVINLIVQRDLIEAIKQKDLQAFKFIITREGGDPFLHPGKGESHRCSPFHTAAMIGCTDIVKYILESTTNPLAVVNLREENFGKTALHFAATNGYLETVRYLLQNGANPVPRAPDLWTPMHYAAENGHPKVIKELLDYGADPDLQNETSQVPAHLAAIYVHPVCFEILLEYYGTHALSRMRETAIVIRSTVPTLIPDACRSIAAYSVTPSNPDIEDDWNKTPLDWAVENISFEVGEAGGHITSYVIDYLGVVDDWFF